MVKKVISGFLVLATSTLFGMSLNQLNSASKTELMEINGIGEVKAAAIVKERRKGKFKSFEDFERVKGVGVAIAGNVQNDVKKKPAIKKKAKKKIEKKPAIKKKAKKSEKK